MAPGRKPGPAAGAPTGSRGAGRGPTRTGQDCSRTRSNLPEPARLPVNFATFESAARLEWERIPVAYKAGVDGLVVERDARAHPDRPDIYTLGECVTEAWPSDFGGPDTVRSWVVLYYGSFLRLSRKDPGFDWQGELWETLTHELRHHLESLADDEALVAIDYAMDESFKRRDGEPFDAGYYRSGEDLGDGWFRVEDELYVERPIDLVGGEARFDLEDTTYRITVPPRTENVAFLDVVDGLPDDAPPLTLVAVRPAGLRGVLRALMRRGTADVLQAEVRAEPVDS